jgi:glycogen debranching enzyme
MTDVDRDRAREAAWRVLEACGRGGKGLRAAAGSTLYPHVWARDVGMAALGILATSRGPEDVALVTASLATLARHQDELGRIPLKVDVDADRPVAENSAGIDTGIWFAITVAEVARVAGPDVARPFVEPALAAIHWTRHLDVNGCGLLESPEASDWADMMPHRHNVLYPNVLYAAALRAGARLLRASGGAAPGAGPDRLEALAADVVRKINLAFWMPDCTDPAAVGPWLVALAREYPEWGLTLQDAARRGSLPFYLPYVAFRTCGRHCDIPGNLLAVITGVAPPERAARLLDHLHQVGAADPFPTKTIDPPIFPGDTDWREHNLWRNLNVPYQYQNGGIWPFIGSLHVAALAKVGRAAEASALLDRLIAACTGERAFPEWLHGRTGRSMGEVDQAWSASGILYASAAIAGRAPLFDAAVA